MSSKTVFSGPESSAPPLEKSLGHLILSTLQHNPDGLFQIDPDTDTKQTRGELRTRSIRVAIELRRLGLAPTDVITICTRNHVNTALPFLAGIYLGATVNVVHEIFNNNELVRILGLAKPKIVLCDKHQVDRFKGIVKELGSSATIYSCDDASFEEKFLKESSSDEKQFEATEVDIHKANALLLCSSGTTGLMKGIPHTHYSFYHAVCDTSYVLDKDDRFLTFSPLVWNSSSWIILFSILFGTLKIAATWKNPKAAMELVEKYKVTYINSNPSKLMALVSDPNLEKYAQMQKLRVIWSRGSPNTAEQMEFYRSKLPNTHVMNAIGCTEMAMMMAFFDPVKEYDLNKKKVDSVGKLCPGVQGKIVDPKGGKILGVKEKGELLLKAECMMPGYYNNPEANQGAFTEDNWYRTGDLAYFDEDQCLFIVGRMKEMIKYNTITVSPTEVEFIINQHPSVQTSCVMGIPDPQVGDLPMAFVVRKPGAQVTAADIITYVDKHASDHQRLRGGVQFLDEMPTTATGKIRRSELTKLLKQNRCTC